MKQRILFYCQHVLGMGHFIRSTEIVRGLNDFNVTFLNGGEIVTGFELPDSIDVINLPPIKCDAEFKDIHAANGAQSLDDIKAIRAAKILDEHERTKADILVIELFPFGRRKFAFELIPLLERIKATKSKTKIVCSLRDILVSKRDQTRFDDQVIEVVNKYFDLLLIHSDPHFQRLEETFPRAKELKCAVEYTGFVAQESSRFLKKRTGGTPILPLEIVVSIGGGRVGSELLDCAIEASKLLTAELPHQMQIFTGPYISDAEFDQLQAKITDHISLERYTTEFAERLQQADLSISMAGYNTCMNILTTGIPAIVYPFTGNNNEEQTIRAEKLSQLGIVDVIYANQLQPEILAAKIIRQISAENLRTPSSLNTSGVEKTACLLAELVRPQKVMEVAV